MTKIERYAARRGLYIYVYFDDDTHYGGRYAIFDKRYQHFIKQFKLLLDGDIDKQLRNNYKKIKKYVDMVYKYNEERRIKYYPKLMLRF